MNHETWRYTTNILKVHRENEHGCLPSPPDPRDFKFAAFVGVQPLPESFSRLTEMPPVRHQGSLGTCVGFAAWACKEWQERQQKNNPEGGLSPAFIYSLCKQKDGIPEEPGCVDAETEFLTITGWKKLDEIQEYDVFFTVNLSTKAVELQKATSVTKEHYEGPMCRFTGQYIDLCLTLHHRCIVQRQPLRRKQEGVYKRVPKSWEIITAKELVRANRSHYDIPLSSAGWRGNDRPVYPDGLVKLLGWIITKGHYARWEERIRITQTEKYLPEIVALCEELGIRYTLRERKGDASRRLKIFSLTILPPDAEDIKEILPERKLTEELLLKLTREQLQYLFETMVKGDGHVDSRGVIPNVRFYQKDRQTTGAFQALCVLLGRHTYSKWHRGAFTTTVVNSNTTKTFTREIVHYKGLVGCPSVPNGTVVIRRNGKICLTGQTYPRVALKVLQEFGDCPEKDFPYSILTSDVRPIMPLNLAVEAAKPFKISAYARLYGIDEMKRAIVEQGPVLAGILVTQNFLDAKNVIPLPGGRILGGHAVCLCAYSDKQEAFLLMNSWGDGWGVGGFSWLPYSFVNWRSEEGIPAFFEAWTCIDLPFALKQAKSIVLRVNEKTAYVDGQAVVLDVAPVIEAGRTLLPVRFIAENLGYIVNWQADTRVVELRRPN